MQSTIGIRGAFSASALALAVLCSPSSASTERDPSREALAMNSPDRVFDVSGRLVGTLLDVKRKHRLGYTRQFSQSSGSEEGCPPVSFYTEWSPLKGR
jgi:hypothetical protein